MDRGLYVSASGMLAEQARQDAIANNLANLTTPGYKADRMSQRNFAELLLANRSTGQAIGTSSQGVQAQQITNFGQGALNRTDQPLDLALSGDGFFAVRTAQGDRYTRNGQFTVSGDGLLVDNGGRLVLSTQNRPIQVGGDPSRVEIDSQGNVSVAGRPAGQLAIVELNNPRKAGGNLMEGQPQGQSADTLVQQGALESSGTDAQRTLVELIASTRNFEANQRVLRTIDESLQRAAQLASVQAG